MDTLQAWARYTRYFLAQQCFYASIHEGFLFHEVRLLECLVHGVNDVLLFFLLLITISFIFFSFRLSIALYMKNKNNTN